MNKSLSQGWTESTVAEGDAFQLKADKRTQTTEAHCNRLRLQQLRLSLL